MWYQKNIFSLLLFPVSLIYRAVVSLRRFLYQKNRLKIHRVSVPVIVVGNITVGGTGKTPLVIALVKELQKQGFHPGIITRGYRGKNKQWPCHVEKDSDPFLFGDEAVLLAQKTGVPVVAGPCRFDDATLLLEKFSIDVIISDDGLQHYALYRDVEILVIDGLRRFGNGFCLPAGPLREPVSRCNTVDFVITNGIEMQFVIDDIVNMVDDNKKLSGVDDKKIMAIAAIGNPDRFFQSLKEKNLIFDTKIFPDHYHFEKSDLEKLSCDIIIMTEKDAVKCRQFLDARCYVAKGGVTLDADFVSKIITDINTSDSLRMSEKPLIFRF
ncbi:MAG: tetraacyldisaccharide 4'-kinase [Coxiellaceae bacterium]|nr:tetraacyldisaccharide 4'-kinase [Coxiellaceae bacterium]